MLIYGNQSYEWKSHCPQQIRKLVAQFKIEIEKVVFIWNCRDKVLFKSVVFVDNHHMTIEERKRCMASGKWVSLKYWTISNLIPLFLPLTLAFEVVGVGMDGIVWRTVWKENVLHNWSHGVARARICIKRERVFVWFVFIFLFNFWADIFGIRCWCLHSWWIEFTCVCICNEGNESTVSRNG